MTSTGHQEQKSDERKTTEWECEIDLSSEENVEMERSKLVDKIEYLGWRFEISGGSGCIKLKYEHGWSPTSRCAAFQDLNECLVSEGFVKSKTNSGSLRYHKETVDNHVWIYLILLMLLAAVCCLLLRTMLSFLFLLSSSFS